MLFMNPLHLTGFVVQMAVLCACLWAESFFPLFMDQGGRLKAVHVARNFTIGGLNALILVLGFSGLVASSADWAQLHQIGLLRCMGLPHEIQPIAGFVLFDLWMYSWHRANHRLPILWRFHRVHHSDLSLDSSSSVRFHIGEMVLSALLRLAVIPLLGISLKNLVLYELILQPVIIFHHSNIALPEGIDRILRIFIVSPNMHRVHHSDVADETNSNYASILSAWDRVWGTYRKRETKTIRYGLADFRETRWQTIFGMLLNPAVVK